MKWFMVAAIVCATVLADLLQSLEMKHQAVAVDELRPGHLISFLARLAQRRFLLLAVFLMAVSFFAFMKLLSISDLSFAVPVTAATIVFETVLAKLFLGESVTGLRWIGAICVASGVALIAI